MKIDILDYKINDISYLKNIKFELSYHQIYGLIGYIPLNIFLRILCGLLPKDNSVKIESSSQIGYFLNDMHFIKEYEVREIIKEIAPNFLESDEVTDLLAKMNLQEISAQKVNTLDDSSIQKLGIFCTLIKKNKIIIIEDCFKNLNNQDKDLIKELLVNYKTKGYLIILSSSVKDDFLYFADKIYEVEEDKVNEIL